MIWTAISVVLCGLTLWASRRDYLAAREYDKQGHERYDAAIAAREGAIAILDAAIERNRAAEQMALESKALIEEWTS